MKKSMCAGLGLISLASAAGAAPASFASHVQTSQPSLWYRFNETAGGASSIINCGSLGAG